LRALEGKPGIQHAGNRSYDMKSATLCALIAAGLAWIHPAMAVTPTQLSFQGILKDALGAPILNSTQGVKFTIYDAPVGGNAFWAESLAVSTDGEGRFTVILGQVEPLSLAAFRDTSRYLGIQVESDPEISPRLPIVSVAYALRTNSIDGAYAGRLFAPSGQPAELLLDNGNDQNSLELRADVNGDGAAAYWYEKSGPLMLFIEPDVDGAGGFLGVFSDLSSFVSGLFIDGNTGSGNPSLSLWSTAGSMAGINLTNSGDAAVLLPDDAIGSQEILDEPGIASNSNTLVTLNTAAMIDIATVTITIPAAGYVVVDGNCWAQVYNTTGYNGADFQIDQVAGGSYTDPYRMTVGYSQWFNLQGQSYSVNATRTYYFGSSGAYTFRLEGRSYNAGGGAIVEARNAHIRATYYPRSYGPVSAAVSSVEAATFAEVRPIPRADAAGRDGVPEPLFQVDLRELELKAARAREAASRAESELLRARIESQVKGRSDKGSN
jgi:hypothetical protein